MQWLAFFPAVFALIVLAIRLSYRLDAARRDLTTERELRINTTEALIETLGSVARIVQRDPLGKVIPRETLQLLDVTIVREIPPEKQPELGWYLKKRDQLVVDLGELVRHLRHQLDTEESPP